MCYSSEKQVVKRTKSTFFLLCDTVSLQMIFAGWWITWMGGTKCNMKSLSEINMDFNQAIQKAEELEQIADGMKGLAKNEFDSALQSISVSWKSDTANDFMSKGVRLREKINRSAGELNSIARTIRISARILYNAEMAAYCLAQTRIF